MRRRFRKIDASFLPSGYSTDKKEYFYAEFYPDGKLKFFEFYPMRSSRPTSGLYLERRTMSGKLKLSVYELYDSEYTYKNGWEDYSGPGSDHHEKKRVPWVMWVKDGINQIWELNKCDIGFDPDNPLSEDQLKIIEEGLGKIKLGMSSKEARRLIIPNSMMKGLVGEMDRSNGEKIQVRYHLREGFDLILLKNSSHEILVGVQLEGNGWPQKARHVIEMLNKKTGISKP